MAFLNQQMPIRRSNVNPPRCYRRAVNGLLDRDFTYVAENLGEVISLPGSKMDDNETAAESPLGRSLTIV